MSHDDRIHEFRGKSEEDIDAQFTKWVRENAGRVSNVVRHPIVPVVRVRRTGYAMVPVEVDDAFSMIIEFDRAVV
jgi:hypothetical protein